MRRNFTSVGLVCVFFLIVAACGGSDTGEPTANAAAADSPTSEPSASQPAETSDARPAFDLTGASPLEQLVGAPINDEEAMNRFYQDLEEQAQRATAECMLQLGFEFTPMTRTISPMEASGLNEDSVEFAERFGFGIAVDFVLSELGGMTAEENALDERLASLTGGEREAYETALWGEPSGEQDDSDDNGFEQWGGGCYGESYETVFAQSPDRVFDILDSEASGIISQYYADPRVIASQDAYATCMADAGYDYETTDSAKAAIASELGDIVSLDTSFEDPWPPDERGQIGMGWNDEFVEFEIAGQTLTTAAEELVDALAEKERAVALVSAECFAPQQAIQLEVQFEYETLLVDQLGDQVRAILAEE